MAELVVGLVSTVIPVHNRADMVSEAVASVLSQTYQNIEIILVDDGSNDGRTPVVLDALAGKSPEVIRVLRQENKGAGPARETGRQAARGEFIQYLDSDDLLLPNKFEVQVEALRGQPDCDIAYGITRLIDADGFLLAEPSKRTGERHEHLFPMLLTDRWWHTSTPLYRRSLSDAAGSWPNRRPEDWDLEARMGALRPRLAYCDVAVSCHRDHEEPGRVSRGNKRAYLNDEAWFLPRLYLCAIRAGMAPGAPEMKRFSRWAFMRARQLGLHGEGKLASQLMQLAEEAAGRRTIDMRTVSAVARMMGWKTTGRFGAIYDHLRNWLGPSDSNS